MLRQAGRGGLMAAIRMGIIGCGNFMGIHIPRLLGMDEMDHYRMVQPAGLREGAAVFPRAIRGSKTWMTGLEERVLERLTEKPLLLTWGMKDFGFNPGAFIPRWQRDFTQVQLVELREAKHYFQEDAPGEIAEAIREWYG
jgi:pimeloyl-ACP methyl ester carboxylesterase